MDFMTSQQWFVLAVCLLFTLIGVLMYMVFKAKDNPIYCWQLIASKNQHGEERTDIDKLGKVVALFVFTAIVIYCVATNDLTAILLALLTLYLSYAGGVASFSAYMRSRSPQAPPTLTEERK